MEGLSRKQQHVGTRRTIAHSLIVKRISRTPPPRLYKSRTDTTTTLSPFPHQCMPPLLPSFRCRHCQFSSTSTKERQYHIIVLHSTRHYHKCHLCPRSFRSRGDFNFHLTRTHEFDPAIAHRFR